MLKVLIGHVLVNKKQQIHIQIGCTSILLERQNDDDRYNLLEFNNDEYIYLKGTLVEIPETK